MRSIVPDEKTESTPVEVMSTCAASVWIISLLVFLVASCVLSFAAPNTQYQKSKSANTGLPQSTISHRAQFKQFTPLNSFAIVTAILNPATIHQTSLRATAIGTIRFYDDALNEAFSMPINVSQNVTCESRKCEEIVLGGVNFVNFDSISVVASLTRENDIPAFLSVEFTCTSLKSSISIIFFVLISAITIVVSITLVVVIARRHYPTRPDHWGTLILVMSLIFIDGPWLIAKYYSSYVFSHIYDITPELFHIVFVLFFMAFFNARTHGWANRILGSWALGIIIAIGLISIVVLQSVAADNMPLNVLSIYIGKSDLKIPTLIITGTMHLIIILVFIIGLVCVQIHNELVLLLVAGAGTLLEALDIIRVCFRFWTPRAALGFSFAADVLYIMIANVITLFFIINNLPSQSGFSSESQNEIDEAMLADTEL